MRTTPPIPTWIKNYRAPGYTNIWELLPHEKKLYGTETLFGDWDGELLILLQDFSTRQEIEQRITAGDTNPYRHDPDIKTNRRLEVCAAHFSRGLDPRTCGILYGSALVGLLKEGDSLSSGLGKWHSVLAYAQEVLAWTLGQMPAVKMVACCGKVAWETATTTHGLKGLDWRTYLERRIPVKAGKVLLFAQRHPVNREPRSVALAGEEWESMRGRESDREYSAASSPRLRGCTVKKPKRSVNPGTLGKEPAIGSPSNSRSHQEQAPKVTITSAESVAVIRFYNPGVALDELGRKDRPMAPMTDLDLPATGQAPMPDGGRAIVIKTISRNEGASYGEVWMALRAAGVDGWNRARKLNGTSPSNGLGVIRQHGYRLTYCVSTGRYRAVRE